MKLRSLIASLMLFVAVSIVPCKAVDIIPYPQSVEMTEVAFDKANLENVKYKKDKKMAPEAYELQIKKNGIVIKSSTPAGRFYAEQTLAQLADDVVMYCGTIKDEPRYAWRGLMLDESRHFFGKEQVLKFLDLMGRYKLNRFHWHLSDDQGWRIEIKAYPELTKTGGIGCYTDGNAPAKFYTQDEIREIVAYAAERNIMVIPEIDMPGHSAYFRNAFGFSMDSEEGMKVLEKCIDEFCNEIPASICPYLHIGSDEVYIADPKGFMKFTENLCKKHNRIAMAWDPGLPSDSTTVRQIWNTAAGSNAASTKKGGKYVDSFMGYLNYYDPIYFTNKVFLHKACAQDIPDTTNALGGILCLWNDVRVDDKTRIALHNGMINGMMVYAERFWNGGTHYCSWYSENGGLRCGKLSEVAPCLHS